MRATTIMRLCVWSGVVAMVVLLIGQGVVARFVPPPSPANSLHETVALYQQHHERISAGLIIAAVGASLLGPWCAGIAVVMRQIEGRHSPLTYLQLLFGGILVFEFLVPIMMWQAAAFRPASSPQITYRLHDLASLTYDGLPMTAALQCVALGLVILSDPTERYLPRWLGWLSFWTAFNFLPGMLNPLAHQGPLAWNGAFAWWLGLSVFGVWIGALTYMLHTRALPALEADGDTPTAAPAADRRPLVAGGAA